MLIRDNAIDGGKGFDWGKEFYEKILDRGLCKDGQSILDIGTGTGVLPRNLYPYGGKWTGIDISAEQIEQAKKLSVGMDIDYETGATENINFPIENYLSYIWRGFRMKITLPVKVKNLF